MMYPILLGTLGLALWPPVLPPQPKHNEAAEPTIAEADAEPQRSEHERTVDRWLHTMRNARYLRITDNIVRFAHPVDDPAQELSRYELRVEAYMSSDALTMSLWEKDRGTGRYPDRPNMVISYADWQVTEDIWFPEHQAYRRRTWTAPPDEAADRTAYPYPQSCMIGLLLHPWPGDGAMTSEFKEGLLRNSVVEPGSADVAGRQCIVLRNDRPEVCIDEDGDGTSEYSRTDYHYFSEDAMLKRWRTVVINALSNNGKNGKPYLIEQDEVLDIEVLEDIPSELVMVRNATKQKGDG